jgi:hypothetical protein
MGIIAVLLYSQGLLGPTFQVPTWVVLCCYTAMGLGTLSGGWKIIETMGSRITKLSHHQGFCASAGGSVMLFAASAFGIRFRRRTPLPAVSSAWAPPGALRPCAGAWRSGSSSPGW